MQINDTALENLAEQVRNGVGAETACLLVGIHPYVLYSVLEKGRAEQLHRQMGGTAHVRQENALKVWITIARAQAENEAELNSAVRREAKAGEWKAAKWLLENSNPALYGGEGYGGALPTRVQGEVEA